MRGGFRHFFLEKVVFVKHPNIYIGYILLDDRVRALTFRLEIYRGCLIQSDSIMDSRLQIELTVSCSDLVREPSSNINPVCILSVKNKDKWKELKRTEEQTDSLNPRWATQFVLDYKFLLLN